MSFTSQFAIIFNRFYEGRSIAVSRFTYKFIQYLEGEYSVYREERWRSYERFQTDEKDAGCTYTSCISKWTIREGIASCGFFIVMNTLIE